MVNLKFVWDYKRPQTDKKTTLQFPFQNPPLTTQWTDKDTYTNKEYQAHRRLIHSFKPQCQYNSVKKEHILHKLVKF